MNLKNFKPLFVDNRRSSLIRITIYDKYIYMTGLKKQKVFFNSDYIEILVNEEDHAIALVNSDTSGIPNIKSGQWSRPVLARKLKSILQLPDDYKVYINGYYDPENHAVIFTAKEEC